MKNTASPPSNTVSERNAATVGPATAPTISATPRAAARSTRTANQRDFGKIGVGGGHPMLVTPAVFFRQLTGLLAVALWSSLPPAAQAAAAPAPPTAEVCVLAPYVEAGEGGRALARVPLARPTLFVREPLRQVRLQRGTRLLWERRSNPTTPLEGPIAWPLPPLRAGERLAVLLQPRDAGATAFARVEIETVPAPALRRNEALLAALGRDPEAWRQAVERALQQGDGALATALLFAFEGPSAPELDALRREAFLRSCP